jgi:hypothetical protein
LDALDPRHWREASRIPLDRDHCATLPKEHDYLVRLAKILDVHKAVKMWTAKGGDVACKYALRREI